MPNPFKEIKQLVEDSFPIVSNYLDTESLKKEIDVKIDSQKLQAMLYGAYNSGKSTLVNVLLGADKAPINDIPTTFKVDVYDWNGIYLLDTPGVNAPIEHEEATEKQVKRSNIILFVIREGDQDSKDLYQRLFNLLKLKKKIFIVLNHQAQKKVIAQQKITEILLKKAREYEVSDQQVNDILSFPVNLKTAHTGLQKKSNKLLEHSGYLLFIDVFKQWLAQYDNEYDYLSSVQREVDEIWFSPSIESINSQLEGNDNSVLDALQSERSILANEKKLLTTSANNFIRQEVNLLKGNISETLTKSQNQSALDAEFQILFNPLIEKADTWLTNEVDSITSKLSLTLKEGNILKEDKISTTTNSVSDLAFEGAKKTLGNTDNIKDAFLLGRGLKIPGLKGRWSSTFDKWAGKAVPAIQLVFAAYEIWSAKEEQDEHNEKARQRSIAIHQAVEKISSSVITDLFYSITENITITFDGRIMAIEKEIESYMSNESGLKKDQVFLSKKRDLMNAVVF